MKACEFYGRTQHIYGIPAAATQLVKVFTVTFNQDIGANQTVLDLGAKFGGSRNGNSFAFESSDNAEKFIWAVRGYGIECSALLEEYA